MSPDGIYILLLIVSIALTALVAFLLVRAGEPFLQEVFKDEKVTRSVNLLLSVLFLLITLGVLAIVSVVDIFNSDRSTLQSFVTRLGVVLIVLGVAFGISMLVLIRVRERRRADDISEQVQERLADRADEQASAHRTSPTSRPTTSTDTSPKP